MINIIVAILVVSTFAAFLLLLAKKSGIVEYIQIHGNSFFSEMFRCDFCLSFWTGLILSIFIVAVTANFGYILLPFCTTPITRILI